MLISTLNSNCCGLSGSAMKNGTSRKLVVVIGMSALSLICFICELFGIKLSSVLVYKLKKASHSIMLPLCESGFHKKYARLSLI